METWNWRRIADAVVDRRIELGMRHTTRLAERAHVSARLLGDVENARRTSYSLATLRALEHALDWRTGSVQAIGEGGDPELAGNPPPGHRPSRRHRTDDLSTETDHDLKRRWNLAELERYSIALEFGDRYGLELAEATAALEQSISDFEAMTKARGQTASTTKPGLVVRFPDPNVYDEAAADETDEPGGADETDR